jgi:methionyl-tRNA synthetase
MNNSDKEILNQFRESAASVAAFYDNFRFRDALGETMNAVRSANKYFNDSEPWKLIRENKERCEAVIYTCLELCHSIAVLISPVLPFTADKILNILNKDKSDFKWDKIGERVMKSGTELGESLILFPQIEDSQIEKLNSESTDSTAVKKTEMPANVIELEDFKKVNLKIAKVIECEKVTKSKKLFKLKLKIGDTEKQIVSGIAEFYNPEDLIGKLIVVVDNLKPSKLMGIDSHGMLLAAKTDGQLKIITVDGEINDGAVVN